MVHGVVVGIVTDNKDPANFGRIKVRFPVDSDTDVESDWVRRISPMAGKDRGLAMIPDIGTEVILGFAYETLTPYVLGSVYNGGDDTPDPYKNEDGHDDHRRFWSRASHRVDFDDTQGAEKVTIEATSESQAVTAELDAKEGTLTAKAKGDVTLEAGGSLTFKCQELTIEAGGAVSLKASGEAVYDSGGGATWQATGAAALKGSMVNMNTGGGGSAQAPPPTPEHKHPPVT